MIDGQIEDLITECFSWIWQGLWRALPLVCIVLLIDTALSRRMQARFHRLPWMIVAVRLVLPVSVESSFSMDSMLQPAYDGITQAFLLVVSPPDSFNCIREPAAGDGLTNRSYHSAVAGTELERPIAIPDQATAAVELSGSETGDPARSPTYTNNAYQTASPSGRDGVTRVVIGVWTTVTICLLFRGLMQSLLFSVRLRRCKLIDDETTIEQILRVCDTLRVGRRPVIKEVGGLTIPAVYGIWRPTICLPAGIHKELSRAELRLILMHEVAHVKHRDGLVLACGTLIRTLHWFNPVAWLVVSRLNHYIERAADDAAIGHSPASAINDYGRLLLGYATVSHSRVNPAAIGLLSSSGRGLARRIGMLDQAFRCQHWAARCFATLLVVFLGAGGLTDAASLEDSDTRVSVVPHISESSARDYRFDLKENAIATEVKYDITDAITKLHDAQPDPEAFLRKLLFDSPKPILKPSQARIDGTVLVITGTSDVQRQIRELLEGLTASGAWQVTYQVWFIKVCTDIAEQLHVDWELTPTPPQTGLMTGKPSGSTDAVAEAHSVRRETARLSVRRGLSAAPARPILAAILTSVDVEQLLKAAYGRPQCNILFAPKMEVFNGQSAYCSDECHRPFVSNISKDSGSVRDGDVPFDDFRPVIDTIRDGSRVVVRGTVTPDRMELHCSWTVSDLVDIALAQLPLRSPIDPDVPVAVQVPTVSITCLETACDLHTGEWLIMLCPQTFSGQAPQGGAMADCCLVRPTWSRIDGAQFGETQ